MTSNKSKPDLFWPLPLSWGQMDGWMSRFRASHLKTPCLPNQTDVVASLGFTLVEANAITRLCNMPHFGRSKNPVALWLQVVAEELFFVMSCFEHSVQLLLSSLQHKKTNRLLKSILSIKVSAAWTQRIWDPVFRAPGYYSNKAHYIKSFCRRAC